MAHIKLSLEKLLTVDDTGQPKPPTIGQLQDKDVLMLFARDKSYDKSRYYQEVGVIYYMGDPKSPPKQRGLSPKECIKEAIENYDLPKDYLPDQLVLRLADRYYIDHIGEAGTVLESLQKSVHLSAIAANRINEVLNNSLSGDFTEDSIGKTLGLMKQVGELVNGLPNLTKALATAYENLANEQEQTIGRGNKSVLSSMRAGAD